MGASVVHESVSLPHDVDGHQPFRLNASTIYCSKPKSRGTQVPRETSAVRRRADPSEVHAMDMRIYRVSDELRRVHESLGFGDKVGLADREHLR